MLRGSKLAVALVEPSFAGNVGSVARLCHNFGVGDLRISPANVAAEMLAAPEAEWLAPNAGSRSVLRSCAAFASVDALRSDFDLVVGTAGRGPVDLRSDRKKGRGRDTLLDPLTPWELFDLIQPSDRVALVFGNEQRGLSRKDLMQCDAVVTIPTADGDSHARSLNLAQSAAVLLYELIARPHPERGADTGATDAPTDDGGGYDERQPADPALRAAMDETVGDLMRLSGYQAHKQEVTAHVTRGVFRRARMSRWEAGRVAGVLRAARDRLASSRPSRDGD